MIGDRTGAGVTSNIRRRRDRCLARQLRTPDRLECRRRSSHWVAFENRFKVVACGDIPQTRSAPRWSAANDGFAAEDLRVDGDSCEFEFGLCS